MSHTYADVKSDFSSARQDLREAASGIRSEAHQVAEGVRSGFRKAEDKVDAGVAKIKAGAMWQPPAWADITKPTNDVSRRQNTLLLLRYALTKVFFP